MMPLANIQILSLAINLPGAVAAAHLRRLGAMVVKVEPPEGGPLDGARAQWYRALHQGQEVLRGQDAVGNSSCPRNNLSGGYRWSHNRVVGKSF
jgi:hypothetical protein